jgi:hypothetical protein
VVGFGIRDRIVGIYASHGLDACSGSGGLRAEADGSALIRTGLLNSGVLGLSAACGTEATSAVSLAE